MAVFNSNHITQTNKPTTISESEYPCMASQHDPTLWWSYGTVMIIYVFFAVSEWAHRPPVLSF